MAIDEKLQELVAEFAYDNSVTDAQAWERVLCHVACYLPFVMSDPQYIEVLHRWRAFVCNELAERHALKLH
jgi:hypothetical protein